MNLRVDLSGMRRSTASAMLILPATTCGECAANEHDGLPRLKVSDNGYAFVYTPTGRPFTVKLGVISGRRIRASWFDPRTGKTETIGTLENSGNREFGPPGRPGPNNDWVLVLDAE